MNAAPNNIINIFLPSLFKLLLIKGKAYSPPAIKAAIRLNEYVRIVAGGFAFLSGFRSAATFPVVFGAYLFTMASAWILSVFIV